MSNTGKCKFPVIEISLRLPSFLSLSMFPPVPYPLYSVPLHIFMNSCLWWKLMRIEREKNKHKVYFDEDLPRFSARELHQLQSSGTRQDGRPSFRISLFLFSYPLHTVRALSLFLHPLPWPSLVFFPLCQSQLQTEDLSFLNNSQVD